MKALRPANTIRIVLLIAFSAALALGSFWLVEVMRRQTDETLPTKQRSDPDFYAEKFNFVRMGKDGVPRYNLTGTEMKHYPLDNSYQIQKPVMYSFSKGREPMVSRSERALIENNNTEVHMYDNVVIDRPPAAGSQHFQLKTSYLLILPDDEIMKTPKHVDIKVGLSTLNGSGMFANNATGEFNLSSNVHAVYQAAHPR